MNIETLKKNMAFTKGIILQIEGTDLFSFADKLVKETAREVAAKIKAENKPDELLTRKQVCEMLGVTLTTLWHWDNNGVLTAIRIGSKVRYRRSDVEAAITKKGYHEE